MHTVRLKVHDSIYEKLIWLLGKFSKDEVEIIPDNADFAENKKYLEGELNEIQDGRALFMELNEAEQRLENHIEYISLDCPKRARKFKSEILSRIKEIPAYPYRYVQPMNE